MKNKRTEKSRLRYESAIRLMYELEQEPAHILQVKNLCMQLFDELKPLHGYRKTERDMLETAAILHDIGYKIDRKNHHKHSLELIRNSAIEGWNDRQKLIIGNIARYHRKGIPNKKHIEYATLRAWDRIKVIKLAAILRLADGLDRSHSDAIKKLNVKLIQKYKSYLVCKRDIVHELRGFKKKRDLIITAFNCDIMIENIINVWHIEPHHFTESMELV